MKFNMNETRKFSIDKVDNTNSDNSAFIRMSLSSETPCLRQQGNEILLHNPENIDLSRTLPNGLPLLVSHNDGELPIGRLKNVYLDESSRKLRGDAYFSGRPEAQAVRKDIEDGILTDVSVGYRRLDIKIEKSYQKGVPDTFYVTRWAPHEASLVAIGFDPTTGVGRAKEEEEDRVLEVEEEEDPKEETGEAAPAEEVAEEAVEAVEEAVEDPKEEAVESPAEEVAEEVKDGEEEDPEEEKRSLPTEDSIKINTNSELLDTEIIALRNIALKLNIKSEDEIDSILSTTKDLKEARKLLLNTTDQITLIKENKMVSNESFTRALANAIKGDFNLDENHAGLIVQKGQRTFEADLFTRANEMTASQSSSAVYEQNIGFLELLKARTCVLAAGARTKTGNGSMSYLRQTGALTATLRAENSGTVANSAVTFDKVSYLPHALVAKVYLTDELQKESVVDLQARLRTDMVQQFALAIDNYAINGNTSPAIAGILKSGSGVYNKDLGVAAKPVFADIVSLKAAVDAKAVNLEACAFILTPGLMGYLESTAKFTNGMAIADQGKINGYKAVTSSNMPVATVNNSIVFGDFSNLEICLQGPTEFMVDTQTRFDEGITVLTARQYFDVGLLQPLAFAKAVNYLIA